MVIQRGFIEAVRADAHGLLFGAVKKVKRIIIGSHNQQAFSGDLGADQLPAFVKAGRTTFFFYELPRMPALFSFI